MAAGRKMAVSSPRLLAAGVVGRSTSITGSSTDIGTGPVSLTLEPSRVLRRAITNSL